MPTKPFEQFMEDAESRLRMFLLLAPTMAGSMSHHRSGLDFGISLDSFETMTVRDTAFHAISAEGDLWIVIYNTPGERGFGLYHTEKEVCVPITIGAVLRTWNDEQKVFQREKVNALLDMLGRLKATSEL